MSRIVIVEDDDALRTFLVSALSRGGHRTKAFADGAGALALLAEAETPPCDLLIADVHLPDIDGMEVARRVRASCPDLQVLFVTGYGHEVRSAAGLGPPGARMLTKPFGLNDLLREVDRMLAA